MASSLLLRFFHVCLFLTSIDLVSSKTASSNESPKLQLFVKPVAGKSIENIEIRCEISSPTSMPSLTSSKYENVYLSVKTDHVKPSGIILMFDDSSDGCRINRENVQIEFCNASLIHIHINHTILNDTIQQIDYSCWKGTTSATAHYRISRDQSARVYDLRYNSSSSSFTTNVLLFVFVYFIQQILTREKFQ